MLSVACAVLQIGTLLAAQTPARELAESVVRSSPAKETSVKEQPTSGWSAEFLRRIPARWDETRALGKGTPAVTAVARRTGIDWFVGVVGSKAPQVAMLRFDFLEKGKAYTLHHFSDGPGHPGADVLHHASIVTAESTLNVDLRAEGGAAFWLTPDVKRR